MITTHSQDAASVSGSKAADQCSVAAEGPVKPEFDPKSSADPGAFPEGGVAAWCTVIGAALIQGCGFGYLASYGVFQDFYTRQYLTNETPSTISWIGGINIFLVSAFSLVAGMLFDRGYFHYVTIGGAVLQSFSLFMLSLTKRGQFYQILLAQSIGCGIALGLMYVPSIAVLSHHFHRRRTLAMTLAASGSPIGAIIHPIMLNNLIKKIGFAHGVRISAAFVSLLLFIACLLMRTRLEPPKRPTNYLVVAKGAIRDLPFLFMTLGLLVSQSGFYYPVFFFQLASIKHGNSMTFSFYSLVIMNASNLIGRMSAGLITSYIGVPKSMTIATFACGVLILGMTGLGSIVSVVILGVLYGYFSGIYIALMVPLMTILTPDLSQLGARMGISFLFVGIASLFGPPASGALLTSQYKWWIPSLFSGLLVLSGNVLFVVMQLVLARRDRAIRRTSAA
ncbi:major facilitator superfamily domain-containing protein [Scleroderma citrinum]